LTLKIAFTNVNSAGKLFNELFFIDNVSNLLNTEIKDGILCILLLFKDIIFNDINCSKNHGKNNNSSPLLLLSQSNLNHTGLFERSIFTSFGNFNISNGTFTILLFDKDNSLRLLHSPIAGVNSCIVLFVASITSIVSK
jgi:hypothetical protein